MKSINVVRNLATVLALPALSIFFNPQAQAVPFTYGNIAVLQEGDGVTGLSTTSAPIAVLEFTPAGSLVQTISIPSTGGSRLTQSSLSASEGFITRSLNSSNLTFVGYDADVGISNVPSTSANGTNRCWGQVDLNGNYTRGASGSSTAFSGSNVRSSVTDGTNNYWMSGTANFSTNQGIWYSAGGGSWIQIITTSPPNTRVTRIFNGKLYYSVAGSISAFSGLPTSVTTATATGIASSSIYDFAINSAGNVAYVCDDSVLTSGGGIQKWTNSGSAWAKAFTFGSTNGLTAGCRGLAVDFSGVNPVIYATTADSPTRVIEITDTSSLIAVTNTTDRAITVAIAGANYAYRGVALAPGIQTSGAPAITGISPSAITNSIGASVAFNVTANGTIPFGYFWYKEIPGTGTNLIANATNAFLTFPSAVVSDTAHYQVVVSNATTFTATSAVVSLIITSAPPSISSIAPLSTNSAAGSTVSFTVTATGNPPLSYLWYKEIPGTSTNLIPSATGASLTLSNILGGDAANYQVVVTASGSSIAATSSVVTLTVTGDPNIVAQPANTYGLLNGTALFTVNVAGTSPGYRWYFSDLSGNLIAPVSNGVQGSGSVISGNNTSTLTIANLHAADPTNFVVIVTNAYGAVTSSVASLLSVNNNATLTFWNFNNNTLNVINPAPYFGVGTAAAVGTPNVPPTSPFFGVVDPADGPGFGLGSTNRSWGTSQYPASGGNKQNGVQFNASTVGAKNITVSYDSRATGTASGYERLQYTTNGTDWIDYPTSSSFIGRAVSTYYPFSYSLAGFPGVANNPNFGIRVVTEFQSTATYGIGTTNNYVGTANNYGTAGTLTYDIVTLNGDAITNNNTPPAITSFMDTNTPDYLSITNSFTVGDLETAAGSLTVSAVSLDPSKVNPTFTFGGSGASRTMIITPHNIPDQVDAAPILVTVTDGNGDSTVTWFTLTLTSVNLAPTNSLTKLSVTNMLVNTPITIPFTVSDDRTSVGGLTYSVASGNNSVIPGGNIVISGAGTANPAVTITPASNQVGVATVSITVSDNDAIEPRSTTANIAVMVRPNTNVMAIDYFSYDSSGPLDTVSGGFWQHLSGNLGQMPVGFGMVTVDTLDNTENLQAQLLGSPYTTNSGAILYSSFIVNMDSSKMPVGNGTYFALFNDGSGVTGNYECRVLAATNGAALGYYRIGINNFGANATDGQMFPQDLLPDSNYVVVTSLVLSNGFSTVWVNPANESSPSVTDTTDSSGTNLFNIADFELRESGANGGSVRLSQLKVGTTFDSVFPALHVQRIGTNAIVNWSDPTLAIQSATNVAGPYVDVSGTTVPYTNNASTNAVRFFRFKP